MKLNPKQDELLIAFKAGQLERVKALLDAGAAVDQEDDEGDTPLILASILGNLEVAKALLDAGAAVDQAADNDKRATPLLAALIFWDSEVVIEMVKALLDAGAAVDQADNDGNTPLSMSSETGNLEVVKALLDAGAAVDQEDNDGNTPLIMASQNGHLEVVAALRNAQYGALLKRVGTLEAKVKELERKEG